MIIITTALIPGKPAPFLVTDQVLKNMKDGSVLVDLAVTVAEFDAEASLYVPLEALKATEFESWKAMVASGFYLEGDAATFRATVVAALEGVIAANAGARVAVVCHGGVLNAWVSHLLGSERLFLFEPVYTSVSRFLAATSGERSLVSLNESAHLRGGVAPPPRAAGE